MPDFIASEIVKKYSTHAGDLTILDGVTLELERGQHVAILGESGSGKSTFLHIAGTLDQPTSGSTQLLGESLESIPAKQLPKFRNQKIGFIFQQHFLLPQLTALENVLVPALADGPATDEQIERAKKLLARVGLEHRYDHRPGLMSGGECQRVAVARALVNEPVLLLADEPTGSLDEDNAEVIGELLLDVQQSNQAMLICVTHSRSLAGRFDKTVELKKGKFQ